MFFYAERILRIINEIREYVYSNRIEIENFKFKPAPYSGRDLDFKNFDGWTEFKKGSLWGERDKCFLFGATVKIPDNFDKKTIIFEIKTGMEGDWDALNPQFLIYVDEKLIQGLDVNHRKITLVEEASKGDEFNILLHAYSGMKEGASRLNGSISILNKDIENFYYNMKVPYDVAVLLDKEDKIRIDIIEFLNKTINLLDLRKPFSPEFHHSIDVANNFLEKEFYDKYCGHENITVNCVGHSHIDVAWLWTLAQTREKTARTFSTVLNMMKEYPEYIFMSSQPQLYKFLKEDQPQLYGELKEQVKAGRWEPEGAMWLEADCNIASGESLVRQVLFGKRFFEKEFNVDNKILWLPDVFGYSAALPQILKKSGVDYFMTTKISWSEYNKLPYDTFMWRGIDGTEILTHFITAQDSGFTLNPHITTYNGKLIPYQIMSTWNRYQQKDLNNEVLMSFGYGDGGGGPTKEMLENARRMSKGIPGCPKVKINTSLNFFNKLNEKVSGNKKLPKWVGELYLEYHRGTYTSMARNKKFNRKCEFLYQDIELLSVINKYAAQKAEYPQEKINDGWEIILLNQFHDILPGSSIKEVYDDSKEQYLNITKEGNILIDRAINDISSKIDLNETSVVVFNQLGFERSDCVKFKLPKGYKGAEIFDGRGRPIPSQILSNDTISDCTNLTDNTKNDKKVLFFAEGIPSKGYKVFKVNLLPSNKQSVQPSPHTNLNSSYLNEDNLGVDGDVGLSDKKSLDECIIRNKYFNITFDDKRNIVSIYDKINSREIVKKGERANVLQAFEDKPFNHDAWDINIYYQEKMWEINDLTSSEIIEAGPVRTVVKIVRPFLDSTIEQYISIYTNIPRIDFFTRIDWKEKQILLKAAFPVDVHSNKASFDIQYGNVERPTHWNTSWDMARFETVVHKWVDLSEDGYGVSLLNDSKYGCDIKDSVMRLSLLKSATQPNIDADREVHEFTYSLYPHAGNWRESDTVQIAHNLNCPMYSVIEEPHEGFLPENFSLVNVDKNNVIIEIVKKAEDSDNIIVRVYECYNRRTDTTLTLFKDVIEAWECDLLENNLQKYKTEGNRVNFTILPYEIKTFKIKLY